MSRQVNQQIMDDIKEYLPDHPGYNVIQVTEVGSGMWGTRQLSSDYDLVIVYRASTRDILSGRYIRPTLPNKHGVMIGEREYDFSYFEIGHLCSLLKKGNVNAIWSILSPEVIYMTPTMKMLRDIISLTHTKDIVHSGVGMTESQLSDAVKRQAVRPYEKALATAYRTANFVLNHLMKGTWEFNGCNYATEEQVQGLIDAIHVYDLNSNLESMPVEDIESWLCNLRITNL